MMSQPLWLLAELTYRCPLQCPYCSNPLEFAGGRFRNELGTEDWCRVFREAKALGVLQLGFPLTVNVVLHRKNLHQVRDLILLAESLGAERIELANTQFYGWAFHNRDALMPTRAQLDEGWRVVQEERARLGTKLEIVWVLPDYHERYPKPCMGGWARSYMTVTPAGEVWPCHAAGRITTLKFANVREHPLEWIWHHSDAFTRFRGDAWMPEPCRSCPRKTVDFGGGRCQAFLIPGDAGVTDPVCPLSPPRHPLDAAVARIAGHDVMRESLAVRRSIGLVFQEPTLDRDLTVEENLRFAARLWDLSGPSTAARIDELLGQFGLAERRDSPVRALSGGLRRAADIARGVLHRPRVLFLDEPTAGLDPRARRTLWQFIRDLRAASGMTVFLTTHYVEEAEPCDRVAVLDRGHVVAQGTPAELKRAAGAGSLEEVFLARTGRPLAEADAAAVPPARER